MLHAAEALFAEFVPAATIAFRVFGDFLPGGVEGKVRGIVGEIEKPRFLRGFAGEVEKVDRVIGHRIGRVEFPFGILASRSPFRQSNEMGRIEEALGADERPVEFFESVLRGIVGSEMPLS